MASVGRWKEMTEVKKSIKEIMRGNATYGISLEKLMKMQEYYIYQHPTNTKLKTSNKDVQWVVDFLKRDGTEAELLETANKSRPKAWVKMNPKKARKKSVAQKNSSSFRKVQTPTMNG